jgi:hypothetical protein
VVDKLVYFLMKRRFAKDANQPLPLFPWETEVTDYSESAVEAQTDDFTAETGTDPTSDGHDKSNPPASG